eukprot:SAG31_NODE_2187_length_6236_cov_2.337135_3_plen_69_part_00
METMILGTAEEVSEKAKSTLDWLRRPPMPTTVDHVLHMRVTSYSLAKVFILCSANKCTVLGTSQKHYL